MVKSRFLVWALSICCGLVLAVSANAALLVYDGFDYTEGGLNGNSGGIGFGTNTWWSGTGTLRQGTVIEGSLSYGPLLTEGNRIYFEPSTTTTAHGRFRRNLDTAIAPSDGDSIWISYLIEFDTIATSWAGVKWPQNYMGKSSNQANWGVANGLSAGAVTGSIPVTTGTHLLVQLIEYADGACRRWMWLNPAFDTLGGADLNKDDAIVKNSPGNMANFTELYGDVGYNQAVAFDELRMGTTYASVTPVIPEPATMLIAATGLMAVYGIRRRSR